MTNVTITLTPMENALVKVTYSHGYLCPEFFRKYIVVLDYILFYISALL